MDISETFLNSIKSGNAVLFLGAGASFGAKYQVGNAYISGDKLKLKLCEKYLGGELKSHSLVKVAECAKHEVGIFSVQEFIKEIFEPAKPAEFHKLISCFRWKAIFTTNYDLIIERAYEANSNSLQKLVRVTHDDDKLQEHLSDINSLPYFKLHGCISDVRNSEVPLILTSEEYAKHKNNRSRLFAHLKEMGREFPIIFCGYDISDPNIHQILFDLTDLGISRPKYMIVNPGLTTYEMRMWSGYRMDSFKNTFEEFMNAIDSKIPEHQRLLKLSRKKIKGLESINVTQEKASEDLKAYIENELQLIDQNMIYSGVKIEHFYKGLDDSWGAFEQSLDFERDIINDIILEFVLNDSTKSVKTCLLKGYAGSGKTIALKRLAWEVGKTLNKNSFYLDSSGIIRCELIIELYKISKERIFLFVDEILKNSNEIIQLLDLCRKNSVELTLFSTTRSNEWNSGGIEIDPYINLEYELGALSEREIGKLTDKLITNNSLGFLEGKSSKDIRNFFKLSAERQLLVALHEVTSGRSFEEIIIDEYRRVNSREAQLLYLDICSIHRFGYNVRAGLISRVSEIGFHQFEERLFKPLEHVIKVIHDARTRDYAYTSRHEIISQIVFEQTLSNPHDKANQILRIVGSLNLDYSSDNDCFQQLLRGRGLAESFTDKGLVYQIYEAAEVDGANIGYLYHQKAVFELNHHGCDINAAFSAIQRAEKENPDSRAVQHTKALIFKQKANLANTNIEVRNFRAEAKAILEKQLGSSKASHAYHALIEIIFDELEDSTKNLENVENIDKRVIQSLIQDIDELLINGLQSFPNDPHLLTLNSRLENYLSGHDSALLILKEAFKKNPRNEFLCSRLADFYLKNDNKEEAMRYLQLCIDNSPFIKRPHYKLAKLLINENRSKNHELIVTHLKRSFSPGDNNIDPQFDYACQQFIFGDRGEGEKMFAHLKSLRLAPNFKSKVRTIQHGSEGKPIVYQGTVTNLSSGGFCFIYSTDLNASVFAHKSYFRDDEFEEVTNRSLVHFNLGFTLKGPVGCDVTVRY